MIHERAQNEHGAYVVDELGMGHDPYPRTIEIHPTDICNHRCAYCFHGGTGFDPKRLADILPVDTYSALFDEMSRLGIENLSIAGGGEPFLDARLDSLLAAAHSAGLDVRLVTHGNRVRGQVLEQVLSCREIRFSVDALYPTTYARLRGVNGALLGDTFTNISDLIRLRNSRRTRLSIGVSFLVCADNVTEVEAFCSSMLALGVDAIVIKHDIYGVHRVSQGDWAALRNRVSELNSPRIEIRSEINRPDVNGRCYAPHFMVVLNPYGEIFSCALGSQPRETNGYCLGTLSTSTFAQVWRSSSPIREEMRTRGVSCTSCNHTDVENNRLMRRATRGGLRDDGAETLPAGVSLLHFAR